MLHETFLAQLKNLLAEQLGLNFSGNGWQDFEARIDAAAKEASARDTATFVDNLLSAPDSQTPLLAHHFTVGETYFFREKESLDALANHVLPALLRTRELDQSRRLRIWSAGCCTGEEAYSIAILLDRLMPNQKRWDIHIIATDINTHFLNVARRAVYNEWSFRGTPDWLRETYFKKKKHGTYELLPTIRDRVKFAYLNLADDIYPSLGTGTHHLDLILCRNVLMYFSSEKAAEVVRRFQMAMHKDSLLVVSPAETSATLFKGFSLVNYPGTVFYRATEKSLEKSLGVSPGVPTTGSSTKKRDNVGAPARKAIIAATAEGGLAAARRAPIKRAVQHLPKTRSQQSHKQEIHKQETHPSAVQASVNNALELARKARTCADQGELEEAVRWCEQAIAADKLNPALHYLLATIEQERSMTSVAIQALQRALYLDQSFVLAHFALANLRMIEGREKDARRHLLTARKLLQHYAPNDLLPEADGLTAGNLEEILVSLDETLSDLKLAGQK